MSHADLDRVRKDLETMKQAAGAELPFGPRDARRTALCSLLAVPLALWATIGPGAYMSLAMIITLVAMTLVGMSMGPKLRRQRSQHPSRWREFRLGILAPLVAAPFVLFGFYWAVANGTPPKTMMGIVLFAAGLALCLIALFSPRRRWYSGMGVATMACGIVMPWCSDRWVGLAIALLFILGGLASAAIQAWQLRRSENAHAAD